MARALHPAAGVRVAFIYLGVEIALTAKNLRRALEQHGHDVVCEIDNASDFDRVLETPVDVVVVAGGDGSVAAVARRLAHAAIPIAVLPLGTANNIAKCLGIHGSVDERIAHWDLNRRLAFDFGVAHARWGRRTFLEGMGCGLVTAVTAACTDVELEDALRVYQRKVESLAPRPMAVTVNDERMEDEFLLAEVLNVGWVGPNLALSSESNPSDGWLEVVLARETDREHLSRYIELRLRGEMVDLELPVRRTQHLEMRTSHDIHIDDQVYEGGPIVIDVQPRAVQFLV